jgi:hypothetical protein
MSIIPPEYDASFGGSPEQVIDERLQMAYDIFRQI